MAGDDMRSEALVAVDWGTSNRRAFLLAADGAVLDARADGEGLLGVRGGDFAGSLQRLLADWRAAGTAAPVLMAGMVGSRLGWREVPYLEAPLPLERLGRTLESFGTLDDAPVWQVRGVCVPPRGAEPPDVMRGEEVQVLGALRLAACRDAVLLLPGTHSKWVRVEAGAITGFATYMTGELFGLLAGDSTLGQLIEGEAFMADAFRLGVALSGQRAQAGAGALLHDLFSVRSRRLFGELGAQGVHSYLSGLLIGAEIAAARRMLTAGVPLLAVGAEHLLARYRLAAETFGLEPTILDNREVFPAGMHAIACTAGLCGEPSR